MRNFADLIRVRNLETGQIGYISRPVFENKAINNGILVEVDENAKPYLPSMYKSKFPVAVPDAEDTDPADEADDKKEDVTDA